MEDSNQKDSPTEKRLRLEYNEGHVTISLPQDLTAVLETRGRDTRVTIHRVDPVNAIGRNR